MKVVRSRAIVRLSGRGVCITIFAALNRVFKQWAGIFNNDAVLTSALLDRLLHHAETVLIEGKSYRANAQVEV